LISFELREAHLGVADPVRIGAHLNVVDDGVLVGHYLEAPGVANIRADRLRSLLRCATEHVGLLIRRALRCHDLYRHGAVAVVGDVSDRVFAKRVDDGTVGAEALSRPQAPGPD
jgi:hypothetical protein